MRPIDFSYAPTVATVGAVAASQTPSGAGAVLINGTLASGGVATMGAQQFVTITSTADISNRTFALVGTDYWGNTVSESLTGPHNSTVASSRSYKTITSVTISGSAAGAITMGVAGLGASQAFAVDTYTAPFSMTISVNIVTGTPTYKLQYTYGDVFSASWPNGNQTWFDHATMTGLTAAADATINNPVTAVRFVITTADSPQGLAGRIIQAGGS